MSPNGKKAYFKALLQGFSINKCRFVRKQNIPFRRKMPTQLFLQFDLWDTGSERKTFVKGMVYLLFTYEAPTTFQFGPVYQRTLDPGKTFVIYHPEQDLPCTIQCTPGNHVIMMYLPLADLHKLFVPEADQLPILNPAFAAQKYYEEREVTPEIHSVLHQCIHTSLSDAAKKLYQHAKALEVISLLFAKSQPNMESCPFLNNELVVRKIKQAKEILLEKFNDPPSIADLSQLAGLNEFQLKAGFKEIYGNTPYQYLMDYKLEKARQLLTEKQMQVNEVADYIGYTNVSHFITAFKKKYGITPKKMGVK